MDRMLYDVRQDAIEKLRFSEEKKPNRLIDATVLVMTLSQTARQEGLFSLKDAIKNYQDEFAKQLVLLVIDGTDPDRLLEIATNTYWMEAPSGIHAMETYFYIRGVLFIQEGENDFVMEQAFRSLIPKKWQQEYSEEIDGLKKKPVLLYRKEISEIFDGIRPVFQNAHMLGNINALEKEIKTLSDRDIQRLLRDVDNHSLAACVYALNQETRGRIFDNLSQRLVNVIKECVVECDFDDEEMVGKSVLKVQGIVNALQEMGEINGYSQENVL